MAKDAELSEILLRAFILRRLALISRGYGNVILMGSRHSAQTLQLREFLSRNGHPYTYVDLDTDQTSQELLDRFEVKASEVPVVICNGRNVLRSPSIQELANCLGFNSSIDGTHVRDVIIVGAGPAGLAAAVYAASEGLDVLMIETQRSRRAGGIEFEDRELPRLPDRDLGTGTGGARHHPGTEVRREHDDRAQRRAAELRPPAISSRAR